VRRGQRPHRQESLGNRSRIGTVVVVSLTSHLSLAAAPGNVLCRPRGTGLSAQSVINASQITTLDRRFLIERIGTLPGICCRRPSRA